MLGSKYDHVMTGLQSHAWPVISSHFRPDCCIAATYITIGVLRKYKIHAKPLSVKTVVYSPTYVKAVGDNTLPPEDTPHEEMKRIAEERKLKVVILGEAEPGSLPDKTRWPGHLVAYIPDQNVIVDSAIQQAQRPRFDIFLPEVLIGLGAPNFIEGGDENQAIFPHQGSYITYSAVPDDQSFRTAPDWDLSVDYERRNRKIIKMICERIK